MHLTAIVATAFTLAVALIAICLVRQSGSTRTQAAERFTQADYQAMQAAIAKNNLLENAYSAKESDVFEAFLWVNSMPPTEPAMKHYVAIANRDNLSKDQIIEKMQADMPKDDSA